MTRAIDAPGGRWYPKAGSLLPDGSIVTGRYGAFVAAVGHGTVYLHKSRAHVAGTYGWEIVGFVRDDLVIVRKKPKFEPTFIPTVNGPSEWGARNG